jgi:gamma-glutamylcyclotransferase (GGCT)/AIG2-like uncharacterized protein YtfP
MNRSLLFVYGTLKKGGGLHSVLGNSSNFKGTYITEECVYDMHDVGCPIVVSRDKGFRIRGEIYNVTPECMERVTTIECNAGYIPFIVEAYDEDYPEGDPLQAIAFVYADSSAHLYTNQHNRISNEKGIKEWKA